MSYTLCIWDPARHGPLPTSADEALTTVERLGEITEDWTATLEPFARALVQHYAAGVGAQPGRGSSSEFWGGNPVKGAQACRSAVHRLVLPTDPCTLQIGYAVAAAAPLGLVVYDDEIGMCFLPDGTLYPEDMREVWASELAEAQAGPAAPGEKKPDGRNIWQRIGGELWDALGR